MSKEVTKGKLALEKKIIGLDKAADTVGSTIGPNGLNVYLGLGIPKVTNDGAKIANEIVLEDKIEDAGAYIIRNISSQQNDDVGDGTTTVTVLTQALIHEILKRPENKMEIRESLQKAGNKILKLLSKKSIKIKKEDVEKVALISAEDKHLASIIAEIIKQLGDKAVINVEDSKTFSTTYEIVDGYEAHVGFMSPKLITEKNVAKAIYRDVPVLCSEKKISNLADIVTIFNGFAYKTNKDGQVMLDPMNRPIAHENPITSCVIICEDIDDSMLGMFVDNFRMKTFNALVIRATSLLLEDIAGYVGAKTISSANGINFQNFDRKYLGFCKKVICDANKTIFIGNGFSHKEYVKELTAKADGEPNMYTEKNMRQRIAKLSGGIAVLRVGSSTDTDTSYLKDKAEDAVKAVQAALAEGIVEGGGITLWRIADELKPKTIGEEILAKALKAPLKKIIENSGKDYADIIRKLPDGMGYDAKNNKYVDMLKVGIIDPTKVERCAVENAVSTASTFCTTDATITDYVEPKKARD